MNTDQNYEFEFNLICESVAKFYPELKAIWLETERHSSSSPLTLRILIVESEGAAFEFGVG
jgi:hypothetical protein